MNKCACLVCLVVFAFTAGCVTSEQEKAAKIDTWEPVLEENFSGDSYSKDWLLEGTADLSIIKENNESYLRVNTKVDEENPELKQSVLWCKYRFEGDLRFVWRAKGETGNKSIFYFNANVAEGSKYKSIFDWTRPDAHMGRYAADENIEMYTFCFLRDVPRKKDGPPVEEFGYLGGLTAPLFAAALEPEHDVPPYTAYKKFHKETLIHEFPSPFAGRPDTWFVCEVAIVGEKITLKVDGKKIFELEDTGDTGDEGYTWTPLTGGGHMAFRNFTPSAVTFDYVKVYRRKARTCAKAQKTAGGKPCVTKKLPRE